MKPRRVIKAAWAGLAGLPLINSIGRSGAIVFCYHGVTDEIIDPVVQRNQMPLERFVQELEWLRLEFDVVSLNDFADLLEAGNALPRRLAVITLDDGYRNNLTVAAPLLRERSLPFTVFLSTRHLDDHTRLPIYLARSAILYTSVRKLCLKSVNLSAPLDTREQREEAIRTVSRHIKHLSLDRVEPILQQVEDILAPDQRVELDRRFASEEPMTWNEARELVEYGGSLGAHSHDHILLHEGEAPAVVRDQIRTSRRRLLEEVGRADAFAYPNGEFGDFSPTAVEEVKRAGYRLAFTTICTEIRAGDNPFALPRLDAEDFTTTRFLARSTRLRHDIFERRLRKILAN